MTEIGNIQTIDIEKQMREAYLDYAMSVIVARALPDARDGLKPVQRRILYAMHDMGIRANSAYKKSARIVGEVLGKYHPHGDMAVYDAMARMAQDFSMRYMLVDGQGNFGSIDGDAPAAMRYTEARLAKIAEELLADIEKDTVNFGDNFDGTLQEPEILPGKLPNLLLNGASGIAVGMATNIPPHNLRELAQAIAYLIDRDDIVALAHKDANTEKGKEALARQFGLNSAQASEIIKLLIGGGGNGNTQPAQPVGAASEDSGLPPNFERPAELQASDLQPEPDSDDHASVAELMVFIKGPDFPTGGLIVGTEGILSAYSTGKGRIVMRGLADIQDMSGGRSRIVISAIPYQVNKTTLIERIAELAREERIDSISDLRDESDRRGMSIVIELKRGAQPKKVLNQLYKFTALQSTFGVQMLALVPNEAGRVEPRLLPLRRALQLYIDHRAIVIRRRSEYELRKARERAHILEGLLIAVANIDAVIRLIREAKDAETAKLGLIEKFSLTERQAVAILDLQLRRLAALERLKIEEEHKQVKEQIAYLEDLIAHPKKILNLIKEDVLGLAGAYGDDRRTRIALDAKEEVRIEDMVQDEAMLISITAHGYIKRVPAKAYRAQNRGGRGVIGQDLKEEDVVEFIFPARSLDTILFFSDKGKVYSEKTYSLPETDRTGRGTNLQNVLALEAGEKVTAAAPVRDFAAADYCTMVTRNGKIKRVELSEFAAVRPSGLIAISLEDGDVLGWARLTLDKHEIIIISEQGQALRFTTDSVRAMGRQAAGVNAMRLDAGDFITSMEVVDDEADLLVVTERGYGKRTPLKQYPAKGRATGGVMTIDQKNLETTGKIVSARIVKPEDDLTVISAGGVALRTKMANVRQAGRATMGTRIITLKEGDTVASVARLAAADLTITEAAEENGNGKAEEAPEVIEGTAEVVDDQADLLVVTEKGY
ncbi:MAG TPA: DNA gyrase subunit A, partial [Anaerolineales bacterium]|nr:DNA gyrase subunit A [Anaerolineales bacterium]